MWTAVPLSLSLLVFGGAFLFTNRVLDAQTVFTAFSLITIMEFPLTFLPYAFTCLTQGITALHRIQVTHTASVSNSRMSLACVTLAHRPHLLHQAYLNLSDVAPPEIREEGPVMLRARGLTVGHGDPLIRNLDISLSEGELLVVVGKVASGKSTLIETLVGETPPLECDVLQRTASIGYASQTPWLFTGTARDNIILGEPFDAVRYARVVKACALEEDFKILSYGDKTIVGERGVNLSGGQKQRISLARTIYKDAKLYLLDDVLSAVDAHVAEHITTHVVRDILKSKAVLLVTHSALPARYAHKVSFHCAFRPLAFRFFSCHQCRIGRFSSLSLTERRMKSSKRRLLLLKEIMLNPLRYAPHRYMTLKSQCWRCGDLPSLISCSLMTPLPITKSFDRAMCRGQSTSRT